MITIKKTIMMDRPIILNKNELECSLKDYMEYIAAYAKPLAEKVNMVLENVCREYNWHYYGVYHNNIKPDKKIYVFPVQNGYVDIGRVVMEIKW